MEGRGDGLACASGVVVQAPRKRSSVAITVSRRRMRGESRYHESVVFITDPWFMLMAREAARSRDLAPVRPVRRQSTYAPAAIGRADRCLLARRRVRGL